MFGSNSNPDMFGILRSEITTSTDVWRSALSASRPSVAVQHTKPFASRVRRRASSTVGSSSTSNMRGTGLRDPMKDSGSLTLWHLFICSSLQFFSLPTLPTCVLCSCSQRDPRLAVEEEHWEEVMNRGADDFPAYGATLHDGRWPVLTLKDEQAIRRDVWRGLSRWATRKFSQRCIS